MSNFFYFDDLVPQQRKVAWIKTNSVIKFDKESYP